MSKNKTQPVKLKVSDFIADIEDTGKRADCRELMKLMREITGNRATMWARSRLPVAHGPRKHTPHPAGNNSATPFG
jgi:hypothetical protein